MKKLHKTVAAVVMSGVMMVSGLAFAACGDNDNEDDNPNDIIQTEGVAGTYTCTYTNGMGSDETAQIVLSDDGKATLTFPGDEIQGQDEFIGTYTVESDGVTVSIKNLTDEDNAMSIHPGIQAGWIDSETGDCQIKLLADGKFERVLTDTDSVETYVSGVFSYTADGVTYEVELSLDGSCGYREGDGAWIEGTYHMDGTTVTVTLVSYTGSANFINEKIFVMTIEQGETAGIGTFTPKVTEDLVLDATLSVGQYSIGITNAVGLAETYTIVLDNGACTFTMENSFITVTFKGTYVNDGGKLTLTGLKGGENATDETLVDEFAMMTGDKPFENYFSGGNGYANVYTDGTWAILDEDGEVLVGGSANTEGGSVSSDTWGTDDGNTVYEGLAYVTDGSANQTLDLYVPDEASTTNTLPLLVVIHGGAFSMGDSKMAIIQPIYQYFRDNGYVVASLNYRLSGEAESPAAIVDCKTAVQWLYDNADEYYIDKTNITVMGESAGAYLAIMSSLSGASVYKADGQSANYTFNVTNLIDFYGPTQSENSNPYIQTSAASLLEGDFNEDLNVWIQHGTADTTVPKTHSEALVAALEACDSYTGDLRYSYIDDAVHMDSAFYTDENIAAVAAWLEGSEIYTYTKTNTTPFGEMQETYQLTVYADGTCTLTVPGATVPAMSTVYTGKYVEAENTLYVYGLANGDTVCPGSTAQPGFPFVDSGCCVVTLNEDAFTPVTGVTALEEDVTLTKTTSKPAFLGGGEEVFTFEFKTDGTVSFIKDEEETASGTFVKYGEVYIVIYSTETASAANNILSVAANGYSILKVNDTSFDALLAGSIGG